MSASDGRDVEALGRLTSGEGGPPGRLTPTEDLNAAAAVVAPGSEGGEDLPGGPGGEARSARGRSPLVREREPARAARGARAHKGTSTKGSESAPGTSITRRKKPTDAQYGRAEDNASHPSPSAAASETRVLATRVDALYVAFRGAIRPEVRDELNARVRDAKRLGTAVAVSIDAETLELHLRSREGWWKLQNFEFQLLVDDGDQTGCFRVEIRPAAMYLATQGPRAALDAARALAAAILVEVLEVRVRRCDLCADVTGLRLADIEPAQLIRRSRTGIKTHWKDESGGVAEHHESLQRTGYLVGKGGVQGCIYNKSAELRNDEAKRTIEHARWRRGGWNGAVDVTRVEGRFRSRGLKEFEDGRLRDPETLLDALDSLWAHFARVWLRLSIVGPDRKHRSRWRLDPRWQCVQNARFGKWDGTIATRSRVRGLARTPVAVGTAINYAVRTGVLRPLCVGSARILVTSLSESERSSLVRQVLSRAMGDAGDAASDELIRARGALGAAEYIVERINAACARVVEATAPWRAAAEAASPTNRSSDAQTASLQRQRGEMMTDDWRRSSGKTPAIRRPEVDQIAALCLPRGYASPSVNDSKA